MPDRSPDRFREYLNSFADPGSSSATSGANALGRRRPGQEVNRLADCGQEVTNGRVVAAVAPVDGGTSGGLPERLGRGGGNNLVDLPRDHEQSFPCQAVGVSQWIEGVGQGLEISNCA